MERESFKHLRNSLDLLISCYLHNCQRVLLPLWQKQKAIDNRIPLLFGTGNNRQTLKVTPSNNSALWQKLQLECPRSIQDLNSSVYWSIKLVQPIVWQIATVKLVNRFSKWSCSDANSSTNWLLLYRKMLYWQIVLLSWYLTHSNINL